jgi:hypothetical protein
MYRVGVQDEALMQASRQIIAEPALNPIIGNGQPSWVLCALLLDTRNVLAVLDIG